MANTAYIKLVPPSEKETVTLDELKDLLLYYKEITSKTGQQLGWHYGKAAFPYDITEPKERKDDWFYLQSTDPDNYKYIAFGIDAETVEDDEGKTTQQTYIAVILPDDATHGDKGKANEFCKFIAKKLQGQLHLFNGRIMSYSK